MDSEIEASFEIGKVEKKLGIRWEGETECSHCGSQLFHGKPALNQWWCETCDTTIEGRWVHEPQETEQEMQEEAAAQISDYRRDRDIRVPPRDPNAVYAPGYVAEPELAMREIGVAPIDKDREGTLLDEAWGLIANAYDGDWTKAPAGWSEAAARFAGKYAEAPR